MDYGGVGGVGPSGFGGAVVEVEVALLAGNVEEGGRIVGEDVGDVEVGLGAVLVDGVHGCLAARCRLRCLYPARSSRGGLWIFFCMFRRRV